MDLRRYLDEQQITVPDFARLIEHSEPAVKKWLRRERIPGREAMARIVKATGGKVRADDFYDLPEAAE